MTVAEGLEDLAVLRQTLLLTREQAAALAGVGLNKIDEWSREPGFPVIRQGQHFVRIVREPFEEWLVRLAERINPPEPPPPYRPQRPPKKAS